VFEIRTGRDRLHLNAEHHGLRFGRPHKTSAVCQLKSIRSCSHIWIEVENAFEVEARLEESAQPRTGREALSALG